MTNKLNNFVDRHVKVVLVAVLLTIGVAYFIHSLQFNGPAYLSDEVNYLAKAAFFSGNSLDAASGMHFGYSLLISPAYIFTNNPEVSWKIVQLVNSLLIAGSLFLSFLIIKTINPKIKNSRAILYMIIISTFPSLVVFSGYSFATPAILFLYTLSSWLLLKVSFNKIDRATLLYILSVGLIFWVHPTGVIPVAVTFIMFFMAAIIHKNIKLLLAPLFILFVMSGLYLLILHPYVNNLMTPEGLEQWSHYNSANLSLSNLRYLDVWGTFALSSASQLSYILISTFGIVFVPLFYLLREFFKKKTKVREKLLNLLDNKSNKIVISSTLVIVGVILLSTLSFSISKRPVRVDYWLYGRYSEVFLLPILAIGVSASWKKLNILIVPLFISVIGLFLAVNISEINTKLLDNSIVNSASFWPNAIIEDVNFAYWFLIGSLGILIISILVKYIGKGAFLLVIPLYVLSIVNQNTWHSNILSGYSVKPEIYNLINDNNYKSECIGFELDEDKKILGIIENERMKLLSYYLNDYNFNRMDYSDWLNNCEGPYITASDEYLSDSSTAYVAREKNSGIYMIVKSKQVKSLNTTSSEYTNLYINEDLEECVAAGCYSLKASEMLNFTVVGNNEYGNSLITTGKPGVLLFGPYYGLNTGVYEIILDSEIINPEGSIIYVKSNKGQKIHYQSSIEDGVKYKFTLTEDVEDIEVSIVVEDETEIVLRSYSIECIKCGY
jgi:hypothetical protein